MNGDGAASTGSVSDGGRVANEEGLRRLGDTIDRVGSGAGRTRATRRSGKPKWSTKRKVLMVATTLVAVLALLVGSAYGYVEWKLDQISSAPCNACTAVAGGAPYNVLIVGSDSRAGNTGAAAQAFGSAQEVGGQRSDTIKILHVDPAARTADILSIPRDTFVQLSGMPAGTGLATDNKINAAFNNGPEPLIQTIQDTLGIPISHYVVMDFGGVINLVNAVGGISLDFNYPVRDDDDGNNNSGLNIPQTGCQVLNGNMALALARSRYYQYYEDGYWQADPTSDLGRIQRQNVIIKAVIDKAKGDLNPLSLNALLNAVVNDISKDNGLSGNALISLALNYKAFSASDLQTYTLPTTGGVSNYAGDVEVVQQPEAQQVITQFLGEAPPLTVTTPPIDQYGNAIPPPAPTTTTAPPATPAAGSGSGSSSSSAASTTTTTTTLPSYDPTPC